MAGGCADYWTGFPRARTIQTHLWIHNTVSNCFFYLQWKFEEVKTFTYLGDIVDRDGGVERAVRGRVTVAWSKLREIAGLLCNRRIPLRNRSSIYEAFVKSVVLYGSETWPLTQHKERSLVSCDRRMLRYMAGVRLQEHVPSSTVAERCGLRQNSDVLRTRRLRWYGHVKRREDGDVLLTKRDWTVDGRSPRGRPRRSLIGNVKEDMWVLNITDETDGIVRDGGVPSPI